MKNVWIGGFLFFSLAFIFCGRSPEVFGAEGLQPLAESQAYQDFLKKPTSDFSKMVCLLNYFRTAPVIVQFEGIDYTPEIAYPVGLVYLMANYITKNRSIGRGSIATARSSATRSFILSSGTRAPGPRVM